MPGMGFSLIGDWSRAESIVGSMKQKFQLASRQALAQEAQLIRKEIVTGIRDQAPAGKPFDPLSQLTLAIRKGTGFSGTKALIRRGDLRNNIVVKKVGDGYFVGVLRTAKTEDGKELVNVARLMEDGGGPFVVPITPKSRAFFHAALRKAGFQMSPHGSGGGGAFAIVKIKARPFMAPVFEKFGKPDEVRARFYARLKHIFDG